VHWLWARYYLGYDILLCPGLMNQYCIQLGGKSGTPLRPEENWIGLEMKAIDLLMSTKMIVEEVSKYVFVWCTIIKSHNAVQFLGPK